MATTHADEKLQVRVQRPVLEQEQLNKNFGYEPKNKDRAGFGKRAGRVLNGLCSTRTLKRTVPILDWLFTSYRWKKDFLGDLVAGATVAVMHVPQGMAYAMLGLVPPITGIHMAFYPVFMYSLLGTSRHISIGTFAVVCIMTGSAITANAATHSALEVASAVSFMAGCIHVLMSVFRLGMLSSVMSKSLVAGFSVGAAIHAFASQLKDLLGVDIPRHEGAFTIPLTLYELALAIPRTNLAALVVSLIAMTILSFNNEILKPFLSKRCTFPVPIELIVVVFASLIGSETGIFDTYHLPTVGDIPKGLMTFALPPLELLPKVAVDAFTIAIVSYAIAMSLGLMFAGRVGYEVDSNQELLALGCANLLGSVFSCMPVTASPSRSALQLSVGGRTQLASIVSCGVLLAVLLELGPFFMTLPRCVLASIIVVALKPYVLQIGEVVDYFRLSFLDGALWSITFLTVVLVNLDVGLAAGLSCSVAILLLQGATPHSCTLEPLPGTDIYVNPKLYSNTVPMAGVQVFQFCGLLNFATEGVFKRHVRKLVTAESPDPVSPIHGLVVDLSGITRIDPAGVSALLSTRDDLSRKCVNMFLAAPTAITFKAIGKCCRTLDAVNFQIFPTVHDAVLFAESAAIESITRSTSNVSLQRSSI